MLVIYDQYTGECRQKLHTKKFFEDIKEDK